MTYLHSAIKTIVIVVILSAITSAKALNLENSSWQSLNDWQKDNIHESLPALKQSCVRLAKLTAWQSICSKANKLPQDNSQVRAFYQDNFNVFQVVEENSSHGLITGYFEPLLQGSLEKTAVFSYPIYGKPNDLKRADDNRYRLVNGKKMPYHTRKAINNQSLSDSNILLWTNDPNLLYFLHVQGSGKIQLRDGSFKHLQFADHNGYKYVSLGALVIRDKIMAREDVNYYSLLTWMRNNPSQSEKLMNENERYIFFALGNSEVKTRGSLNVPLTPQRSIAIDPKKIPQGYPLWLETTLPQKDNKAAIAYNRLMFAQDTGAAIKGAIRADVFFGSGDDAEFFAGNMKQDGRLFLLKPKGE